MGYNEDDYKNKAKTFNEKDLVRKYYLRMKMIHPDTNSNSKKCEKTVVRLVSSYCTLLALMNPNLSDEQVIKKML